MAKLEITKQVPLSKQLLEVAERRIDQLGIKFPEYVRHLIIEDTKNRNHSISYLSQQEEMDLATSLRDIRKGRVTTLKSDEEIEDYFDKLSKEDNG